jgi:hypothetical protein
MVHAPIFTYTQCPSIRWVIANVEKTHPVENHYMAPLATQEPFSADKRPEIVRYGREDMLSTDDIAQIGNWEPG